MTVKYDQKTKTWSVKYEKDDLPVTKEIKIKIPVIKQRVSYGGKNGPYYTSYRENVDFTFNVDDSENEIRKKLQDGGYKVQSGWSWMGAIKDPQVESIKEQQVTLRGQNKRNEEANNIAKQNNEIYKNIYTAGTRLQKSKTPGNYLTYVSALNALKGNETTLKSARNEFDKFYTTEIVSLWDQKDAAKVPFEGFENTIRFDPNYYATTTIGAPSKAAWDKAVKENDLDIVGRYGNYESYALWHYSNVGKNQAVKTGQRDPGFKPLTPLDGFDAEKVLETVPGKSDAERQAERDKVVRDILGLQQVDGTYQLRDVLSQYENLVKGDKALEDQWQTAKAEILYSQRFPDEAKQPWAQLYDAVKAETGAEPEIQTASGFGELLTKAYQLDPKKYSSLQPLLNPIKQNTKIGEIDTRLSEYDVALTGATSQAEAKRTQQAAVLQKQFLEDARRAMLEAQRREQRFDLLSGTSFGQELLGMRGNITDSLMQELGVGGILPIGGTKNETLPSRLGFNLDTGKFFGSNNGLLYNWEKWFHDEIEKKYSGGLDVPNDYVPLYLRKPDNNFATQEQLNQWKKYDEAYEKLKQNPNDLAAKNLVNPNNLPKDYIPVNQRKEVKQEWLDYEAQRRAMGWVDQETLANWIQYDDAYKTLQDQKATPQQKADAQKVYDKRPADYIVPEKRIQEDLQFKQDFFNDYLLPRFNASKSMSEFVNYIDVDRDKQNIFQTEDRLTSIKRAAEAASSAWMRSLDALKPTKFNSEYYFDPANYYITKGIGSQEGDVPVLLGEQFQSEWGTEIPKQYVDQKNDVSTAWEAAKQGKTTNDASGKPINWQAKAYLYGLNINNQEDFAKLHFELVGKQKQYDSAPDVFNPKIAQIYLKQVLIPYVSDRYAKIGTVFGEFADPEKFANDFINSLDPLKNREQVEKVLTLYGLDPKTEDLTELKQAIAESIKSGDAVQIREQIKNLNQAGEVPTQEALGVQYIQRASDVKPVSGTTTAGTDALYNKFKEAGYQGSQDEFYSSFMPDATEEDRQIFQSAFGGKGQSLAQTYKDRYTFKSTGDIFTDFQNLQAMAQVEGEQEEESPLAIETIQRQPTKDKKYFTYFPDEADQPSRSKSPFKVKTGQDIINEFRAKLNLPPATTSLEDDSSSPFSGSMFGSF